MTNREAEVSPRSWANFSLEAWLCHQPQDTGQVISPFLWNTRGGIGIALICLPYPLHGRECILVHKALGKSNVLFSSQRTGSEEGALVDKYSVATMARVSVVRGEEMPCSWVG